MRGRQDREIHPPEDSTEQRMSLSYFRGREHGTMAGHDRVESDLTYTRWDLRNTGHRWQRPRLCSRIVGDGQVAPLQTVAHCLAAETRRMFY